jgi:hypothetical protein
MMNLTNKDFKNESYEKEMNKYNTMIDFISTSIFCIIVKVFDEDEIINFHNMYRERLKTQQRDSKENLALIDGFENIITKLKKESNESSN